MINTVLTREFSPPDTDRREIERYMGVKNEDIAVSDLIDSCLKEVLPVLKYNVCWITSDIVTDSGIVEIAGLRFNSASLTNHFANCERAVIFASTIGIGIDRYISCYSRLSPSRAFCIQAIGAERIESLCEAFCDHIRLKYGKTTSRFSPGYGDLDINVQKDIFRLLNSAKNIGLTLNDSMIMSPSKSVTALIGIMREELK